MSVSAVSSSTTTQATTSTSKTGTGATEELGQDAFMQLLLAQLRNQDPLKPMEDKDFIAQLAQFNSLSQLTAMATKIDTLVQSQSINQGASLIGKTVSGTSGDSVITGVVTGLQVTGGKVVLSVDGQKLPLGNVQSVTQTEESSADDRQSQSDTSSTTS